ncbi:UDP-N-acetylglucosamine 2-epimerase [uncultured Desulfobulbus sp.]|uniref:UDP-N-acetylglucosamine 2-epimerase n=1 Tax=uncultured Desulfobulbus sp. TaxID=239745 RepID=UPI0029C73173|nr:UDP-N-acetylglucosamine 2-epimerase [uncultured Desulfobulbus sp.]
MKKILGITSIRSDYDLMSSLYRLLADSTDIEFKLLVSGAHLSQIYGNSVDLIKNDGFDILLTIESLIDSDSRQSRLKTASLFLQNAIDTVAFYQPDLILLAGDREDVIMGALIGGFLEIPTLHFYGGDHTQDGHIDNPVRHATSKLVSAHMVSHEEHRQRLIRIGESPDRIFTIGSIALDRFVQHSPISKSELRRTLGIQKGFKEFALLIFHPVTEEQDSCHLIFRNILNTLKRKGIHTFVSTPNTDPGNKKILHELENYHQDPMFFFFKNFDRDTFLSIFKNSRFIIGNSSAGILESASIPIPAINIGLRQTGRKVNKNVIFCDTSENSILFSIEKVTSASFSASLTEMHNIYGNGDSAPKAFNIIKSLDFKRFLYKKEDPLQQSPEIFHGG